MNRPAPKQVKNSQILELSDRFQGALLGLAVGDALGTTLEFKPRGSFEPMTDMQGGGPFALLPGQWTDDTSMAICLAESLLEKSGFDAADQMLRYLDWWTMGTNSSTGRCFDIGNTVVSALQRFQESGDPWAGSRHPLTAGNGSLMRLVPVVLYYFSKPSTAIVMSGESSRTTHGAKECIDACCYFAALLITTLQGADKTDLIATALYSPTTQKVAAIQSGEFISKPIEAIRGNGYVIDSLEAALWCFFHTENLQQALLQAANLGEDADTTAAICGQLAGAFYGQQGIPAPWLNKLWEKDRLAGLAAALLRASREG